MRSKQVHIDIDLDRVRASAEDIRRRTGVPLIAVIKADAYGLGAPRVADALASIADDFAYFSLAEAREVGKAGLIVGPIHGSATDLRELGLRPTLMCEADGERFRGIPSAISLDTGMQRFGCTHNVAERLAARGDISEIYTHARDAKGIDEFVSFARPLAQRLHVAASALLQTPAAWLDGVRPGVALYRGAVRVTTRLASVRETHGPIGYTGFEAPRVGILLLGYSNLLGPVQVVINGRRQRTLEIGMNSTFVSVDPRDREGDEVVLLGPELPESEIATALRVREHEVLCRYCSMGVRHYRPIANVALSMPLRESNPTPIAVRA